LKCKGFRLFCADADIKPIIVQRKASHMKTFFSILALVALLGGCAVHTPSGSVIVDPHDSHGGGGFCPPGQAKKGNC